MNSSLVHHPLVRHGVLGGAAMAAAILLGVFYSVVAGAVDRAAERRVAPASETAVAVRRAAQPAVDVRAPAGYGPRTVSYSPGTVSYLRPAN